jgi:hypothetical protein
MFVHQVGWQSSNFNLLDSGQGLGGGIWKHHEGQHIHKAVSGASRILLIRHWKSSGVLGVCRSL